MNGEQRPSLLVRILSIAFFSALTLAALTWFFISITELISKFRLGDPVVGFDKGSMYMLGLWAWSSLIKHWRSDTRGLRIRVDPENGSIIHARHSNQPLANVRFSAIDSLPSRQVMLKNNITVFAAMSLTAGFYMVNFITQKAKRLAIS